MTGPPTPTLIGSIGDRTIPIHLGAGLTDRLDELWPVQDAGSVLVVTDAAVADRAETAGRALERGGHRVVIEVVASGEPSKSLGELERLSRVAARHGIRRSDTILAVGGGVIGDLAGFLAASYQRGIRLVHVPTTLLAMVDSAIGGKTGVDLPEGKNYVGAIWQPAAVVMDTDALSTLPAQELSAGFAEIVKYGLLEGGGLYDTVATWPELPGPPDAVIDLITRCVAHKLRVVAEDEHDLGVRATLNFGHTIGHGIEAAAGYERYLHGEAISLGMLAALRISEIHLGLAPTYRDATLDVLTRHRLPTRLDPQVATSAILDAMGRDKKSDATALNMVLLDDAGSPVIRQNPSEAVVLDAIEELR